MARRLVRFFLFCGFGSFSRTRVIMRDGGGGMKQVVYLHGKCFNFFSSPLARRRCFVVSFPRLTSAVSFVWENEGNTASSICCLSTSWTGVCVCVCTCMLWVRGLKTHAFAFFLFDLAKSDLFTAEYSSRMFFSWWHLVHDSGRAGLRTRLLRAANDACQGGGAVEWRPRGRTRWGGGGVGDKQAAASCAVGFSMAEMRERACAPIPTPIFDRVGVDYLSAPTRCILLAPSHLVGKMLGKLSCLVQ